MPLRTDRIRPTPPLLVYQLQAAGAIPHAGMEWLVRFHQLERHVSEVDGRETLIHSCLAQEFWASTMAAAIEKAELWWFLEEERRVGQEPAR